MNQNSASSFTIWKFVPALLLVVSVSGWLWMVSLAVSDPGFSVEADYYKKAANFDVEAAQRVENRRLGWSVRLLDTQTTSEQKGWFTVLISDRAGAPLSDLSVAAEGFAVARGGDVRALSAQPLGEGRYRLQLDRPRVGLWVMRLRVQRAHQVFAHELRTEFFAVARGGPPS